MNDSRAFTEACQKSKSEVLFCHQTFLGGKNDNGFYAPDGISLDLIPQTSIISGHLHCSQIVGKCRYVGSPRWMTASDANQEKVIEIIDIEKGTRPFVQCFYTSGICSPIWAIEETPGKEIAYLVENARYIVDLTGSAGWIEERKAFWEGKARVRTHDISNRVSEIRESEGIPSAFRKYFDGFELKYSKNKELLRKLVSERCGM
jgi:hypothetical protein